MSSEADAAIPVENSRILASRIRSSELVIFPKAGLLEADDEPNRLALDFLKRLLSTKF